MLCLLAFPLNQNGIAQERMIWSAVYENDWGLYAEKFDRGPKTY